MDVLGCVVAEEDVANAKVLNGKYQIESSWRCRFQAGGLEQKLSNFDSMMRLVRDHHQLQKMAWLTGSVLLLWKEEVTIN